MDEHSRSWFGEPHPDPLLEVTKAAWIKGESAMDEQSLPPLPPWSAEVTYALDAATWDTEAVATGLREWARSYALEAVRLERIKIADDLARRSSEESIMGGYGAGYCDALAEVAAAIRSGKP